MKDAPGFRRYAVELADEEALAAMVSIVSTPDMAVEKPRDGLLEHAKRG